MNILLVPDSFKYSLSAQEVALAMEEGIKDVFPEFSVISQPVADGGEGTILALINACGGNVITEETCDPLFRPIQSNYGVLADNIGVVEVAEASGVSLLMDKERNPMLTSSLGTGKQIVSVLEKGVRRLIIGLGGSGTNDGGIGVLHALGYRFYDEDNQELPPIGKSLLQIRSISSKERSICLDNVKIQLAVDVTNPLYGEKGAAYIFAPQKGATDEMVYELDQGLRQFHRVASQFLGSDFSEDTEGFGAAGGIAFGLVAFLGAEIVSGIKLVSKQVNLEEKIKVADLVISGEGKIDSQSLEGKVISGIAKLTTKHKKPLVLLGGMVDLSPDKLSQAGITAAFSVSNEPMKLEKAIRKVVTKKNLRYSIGQVLRVFNS